MVFKPSYICPQCGKQMQIRGTKCPYCNKTFTVEEVDDMYFVCPTCLHDEIEILLNDNQGNPNYGIKVRESKYVGIIRLIQECINTGFTPSFVCQHCATKFDSSNFVLVKTVD